MKQEDVVVMTVDEIAGLAHDCARLFDKIKKKPSGKPWKALSKDQRSVLVEIFSLDINQLQSNAIHEKWLNTMLRAGWRYGAKRNVRTKSDPLVLPFDELDATSKLRMDWLYSTMAFMKRQVALKVNK